MGLGEQISNMKRAEEALAKLEAAKREKENLGLGEASKLPPESPFIQKMKEERLSWEIKQREILEAKRKTEEFKLKKAKRLEQIGNKKQQREQRNKKIKASLEVVKKMNADIHQIQLLMGRLITSLDTNAPILQEEPYFKIKAQRVKRMLSAYYYGLNSAVIRPKLFDER